ncbi:MAG: 3-dehydroquinate synthase [Bacteroidota bacterium]
MNDTAIKPTISTPTIHQQFSIPYEYKVLFTENLFAIDNPLFVETLREDGSDRLRKMIVVVDSEVARLHPYLENSINDYCGAYPDELAMCGSPLIIQGGESAKNNFQLVQDILQLIDDQKIDRHAYVLGIGGGAILDLVGFVAAIAHRGIRHIRIPTTVLSQNDSGVGVKNGINYFNKKNYLGTFVPPFAVINDTNFLLTLNDRDWRAGISEAVKVALIRDEAFYYWIAENAKALDNRDLALMKPLIYRCAKHHMQHIATNGDPFEKGSSRPLDFGHWAAHKLEQLTDYEVRHGEAVAIGIALDVAYSYHIGLLDKASMQHVHQCLRDLGFAIFHPLLYNESKTAFNPILWEGLEEFREHLGGELTIMLLDKIGHGVETHEMDLAVLGKAMAELA